MNLHINKSEWLSYWNSKNLVFKRLVEGKKLNDNELIWIKNTGPETHPKRPGVYGVATPKMNGFHEPKWFSFYNGWRWGRPDDSPSGAWDTSDIPWGREPWAYCGLASDPNAK